jgi:6-phosphogluconolactonase
MKNLRRVLFASLVLCMTAMFSAATDKKALPPPANYLVFAGSYTTKTTSQGINVFRFDGSTGKITRAHLAVAAADPSWVVVHPNGKVLYAANEAGKNSMVSAYAIDATSETLTLLNQLPARGEDPCYLSFDRTGQYLFAANYSSGNVVVFPILRDGRLGEPTANVQDQGALGPNRERQDAPHAHWIAADGHFVYVSDLALDRILMHQFDGRGLLTSVDPPASPRKNAASEPSPTLAPGTGPRHATFSANEKFLYVLGELQSTVTVFASDAAHRAFQHIQQISALPAGFSGRNDAAEIALDPSGRFLYTSNRGDDSIAVFSVNAKKGILTLVANVPTGGKEPRHFAIDPAGRFLLAENQFSDNVVEFAIDPKTGNLNPTGEVLDVPSPVCLAFLRVK